MKEYLSNTYADSKNDLLGIFVHRGLDLLRQGGRLGAITSRTCFFVTSFSDWRKNVVLTRSAVEILADLGHGVMDDAMVEAAAYVLECGAENSTTKVIRAIADEDRQKALDACSRAHRQGTPDARLFDAEKATFELLPDAPFVYWANAETLRKLAVWPTFEPAAAQVRKGLRTGDNFRFVRALWEIPIDDLTPNLAATDTPKIRENSKWVPLVLSGSSQPWFSPLLVALNWRSNGKELRQYVTKYGSPSRLIQAEDFYFKPGMSWTLRASRFVPYAIPSGCIPTGSRPMAFPNIGHETLALAVSASRIASAFMRFYGDWFTRPKFLEGKLKLFPWPVIAAHVEENLDRFVRAECERRKRSYQGHEPFFDFIAPFGVLKEGNNHEVSIDWHSLLGADLEASIEESFELNASEAEELYRELDEALAVRSIVPESESDEEAEDEGAELILDTSDCSRSESNVSFALGCSFGRWDVRYATGEKTPPTLSDPFAPLSVCPPGQLQNDHGMSVTKEDVDRQMAKGQWSYPLEIPWDGILVDNAGHPADIEERVHRVIKVVWADCNARDHWESIERDACANFGVRSLRDYFGKPTGFFADHLRRYTKSRRKAPIYWPLSTASSSYTLWVYYHRLNSQTLYTAINNFVEPKLKEVGADVTALRNNGVARSRDDERQFETLQAFELELIELRDTLLVIAPGYQPNHDDGVQITAAPLWPLFRHKPWQKVLKDTWAKLEKGDYDWAHLAMNYWPERVREKCKTDKSLAIAHGLEELYVEPEAKPKKTKGRKAKED